MKASIITPTLNAADWIEACVANVAQQGDAVLEHIVVDGGSGDGTLEKAAALARGHPRLTILPRPGCSQSVALNLGSEAASGEAIGILNADDFYEAGAVRRGVEILGDPDAPAFVAGDCLIIDDARRFAWNRPNDLRIESLLLGWDAAQFPCNPSAYFYRREAHYIVGGYDPADDFTMDMDFVLKCAAQVGARHVPEHWGNFRFRAGSKTFEDRIGRQRRSAMFARHLERLAPHRRGTMARIGQEKQRYWSGSSSIGVAPVAHAGGGSTMGSRGAAASIAVRLSGVLPVERIG